MSTLFVDIDAGQVGAVVSGSASGLLFAPEFDDGPAAPPRWYDANPKMTSSDAMAAGKKTPRPEELEIERRREQLRRAQSDARQRAAARRAGAERALKTMDRKIAAVARSMTDGAGAFPNHQRDLIEVWAREITSLRKSVAHLLDDVRLPRDAKTKRTK
ncbi:MAG: hypothetical protein E6Q40_15650 [Cupriavidus sp.]|nr:MAG: hypothetical protein E6Q40_15650 [Cupriavidus sp.]